MNRLSKLIRNGICAALLVIICLLESVTAYAANLHAPSLAASSQRVLDVMETYNPDVSFFLNRLIVNDTSARSSLDFYLKGETIASGMDTCVHETYHLYTFRGEENIPLFGEKIYVGDGYAYTIDYTMLSRKNLLFPTSEAVEKLPSSLRTGRYSVYVCPGESADANVKGPVGLLNEFSAYYWGLSSVYAMRPYFLENGAGKDEWDNYALSLGNNMNAYAEFRFWILTYMNYAREYHPDTYQAILADKNICGAYAQTETRFADLIAKAVDETSVLNQLLSSKGISFSFSSGGLWCYQNNRGRGVRTKDYDLLMKEMQRPEYVRMDAILKEKAGAAELQMSATNPAVASEYITMVTTQECSVFSKPSTDSVYREKRIPEGYRVQVIPVPIKSLKGDGKIFYKTVKGKYVLARVLKKP